MNKFHTPVLVNDIVDKMSLKPHGIYVDCTVGGGGHSYAMLQKEPTIRLYCFDQDEAAVRQSKKTLCAFLKGNVKIFHENFQTFRSRLSLEKINKVDGILFDLGVSQYQINEVTRGFSFMQNSKLDMRMNKNTELTAFDLVNTYSQAELQEIFFNYGEEHYSKKIAHSIVKQREIATITSTKELSDIIDNCLPPNSFQLINKTKARIFQAIRIVVNNELAILQTTLKDAISTLRQGGRLLVVSWHSLEDRIVKKSFNEETGQCVCSRDLPQCICNLRARLKIINKKPLIPSVNEVLNNPYARSAKLRIAERV